MLVSIWGKINLNFIYSKLFEFVMERVVFKNLRNQSLVGHLYASESKSIIIMSHGIGGDKSENGKFDKIAQSLNKSGFNVLTFDFSGFGESDDETVTLTKMTDDLKSAIKFVQHSGYKKIGLFGWSLGGLVSLKCFKDEIDTMFLWAPITNKINYDWWKKHYSSNQLKELKDKHKITKIREKGLPKNIILDFQLIEDLKKINQKNLLRNINCPILIIHGKKDNIISYRDSEEAIKLLSNDSRLELVDKADHEFYDYLDIIVKLSNDWFLNHLER